MYGTVRVRCLKETYSVARPRNITDYLFTLWYNYRENTESKNNEIYRQPMERIIIEDLQISCKRSFYFWPRIS